MLERFTSSSVFLLCIFTSALAQEDDALMQLRFEWTNAAPGLKDDQREKLALSERRLVATAPDGTTWIEAYDVTPLYNDGQQFVCYIGATVNQNGVPRALKIYLHAGKLWIQDRDEETKVTTTMVYKIVDAASAPSP